MTKDFTNILKKMWRRTIVDKSTNCWLAQGFKDKDGYVKIYYSAMSIGFHRISARIHYGLELNSKLQANHNRNCPNANCWNPDHIYVGTQSDNRIDSFMLNQSVMFGGISSRSKGQIKSTTCKLGHLKLGKDNRCLVCKQINRNRIKNDTEND